MVVYRDLLFEELKEDIRMTCGALEDVKENEAVGYSYMSYSEYIMKSGMWCKPIILKVIASMWACRITVIHADNFYQTRIRHKGDPYNADIVWCSMLLTTMHIILHILGLIGRTSLLAYLKKLMDMKDL